MPRKTKNEVAHSKGKVKREQPIHSNTYGTLKHKKDEKKSNKIAKIVEAKKLSSKEVKPPKRNCGGIDQNADILRKIKFDPYLVDLK